MKIRYKVTCWITGAGLLISLIFSLVIFMEMREQLYDLVDAELGEVARAVDTCLSAPSSSSSLQRCLAGFDRRFWIKVYDAGHHAVYRSALSAVTDIPLGHPDHGDYTVRARMEKSASHHPGSRPEEEVFRVRVIRSAATACLIQVATPMERLVHEIRELLGNIAIGLLVSTVVLVILSFAVAGRILRPIGVINRLSREIDEKSLDRRIPLGESRDELYTLSSSLNRMFDRLQHSFEKQKQFLAAASHEMKSPAAMLRLFFEEAMQRGDLPPSFQSQLIRQSQVALRMERLIKDLMALSVLELDSTLKIEQFSLSELIHSLLADFSLLLAERQIRMHTRLSGELRISADKDKIRRLLINILDNAVKYNVTGGEIRLTAAEDRYGVTLTLFNTGPGIPKADLEKVFDQFYRVEKSRSLQYGGAGLGLSIVQQIARRHGGTVTMESASGSWARIRISLPHRSPAAVSS
jgi:signal transduction histidine kinase